jgi:DNA-binding transcriptional ArsR family regulator
MQMKTNQDQCRKPEQIKLPAEYEIRDSSELFKVLGDQTRMRLICILLHCELCVHDLSRIVNMSQSAVSHQLRVMRQAHLVRPRRDGKHTWYSLADEHVRDMVELAMEHVNERYQNGITVKGGDEQDG